MRMQGIAERPHLRRNRHRSRRGRSLQWIIKTECAVSGAQQKHKQWSVLCTQTWHATASSGVCTQAAHRRHSRRRHGSSRPCGTKCEYQIEQSRGISRATTAQSR